MLPGSLGAGLPRFWCVRGLSETLNTAKSRESMAPAALTRRRNLWLIRKSAREVMPGLMENQELDRKVKKTENASALAHLLKMHPPDR